MVPKQMVNISVCIPTYNSAKTLRICLDSVFRQTVRPKEVLICDGGSHDETLKIVGSYPVKLVAKNIKGVGAARKILTSASSGELIAWIDADAAIPTNWLELRVKLHQTQPDVDCLSGPPMVVSIEDGKRLSRQTLKAQSLKLHSSKIISWTATTLSRQAIKDVGGFDPLFEWGEEWDLTTRLIWANAGLYWVDGCPAYHLRPEGVIKLNLRKYVLGGTFVLYLLKYGPKYIKFNPRHFIAFILRMWLLYSLLILPFFSKLMLLSLLAAIVFNLIAVKLHTKKLRLDYIPEQLFNAIGEHRNFVRYLIYRPSREIMSGGV
jgi:glycosyltransferase involved in cell wall biosynthesis